MSSWSGRPWFPSLRDQKLVVVPTVAPALTASPETQRGILEDSILFLSYWYSFKLVATYLKDTEFRTTKEVKSENSLQLVYQERCTVYTNNRDRACGARDVRRRMKNEASHKPVRERE